MDIFSVLNLIGGLSLFLYGMNIMGDGLRKASGGKLEIILEKLTANKFMAVILGAVVTTIMQSSSATTVMVVGFVNSGIMTLERAVGVILGANIGATTTPWILSLSSISGAGTWLKMLKPTSFAPIISIIGVGIIMFSKSEKKLNIAQIMVGFAVLMFGMSMMSAAAAPLQTMPEFRDLMVAFSNPVIGLFVGLALTAIIQSSAATIGILQVLCGSGLVTFGTVIPIVLGANIGTCATAMLSSIGTGKNARRSAIMHLSYNIIKSFTFVTVFYSINAIHHISLLDKTANAFGVATFDTCVSVTGAILMFPISKCLVNLAYRIIPKKEDEDKDSDLRNHVGQMLDDRFLSTPEFAVEQAHATALEMVKYAREGLFLSIDMIGSYNEEAHEQVLFFEDLCDHYENALDAYFMKLSTKHLSPTASRQLSILMHSVSDIERISDHAINISEASKEMLEKNIAFSRRGQEEFDVYTRAVKDVVNKTVDIFENRDERIALDIEPMESIIDDLSVEIRKRHVRRLRKGKCSVEMGFVLSDLITNYERISDHCSNIALNILQNDEDRYDMHDFQDSISVKDNAKYLQMVEFLSNAYKLPEMIKNIDELEDAPCHAHAVEEKAEEKKEDESSMTGILAKTEKIKDAIKEAKDKSDKDKKAKKSKKSGKKK